jgi:hypothetical protein
MQARWIPIKKTTYSAQGIMIGTLAQSALIPSEIAEISSLANFGNSGQYSVAMKRISLSS